MPSNRNIRKVWVTESSGRSFFGWKIKEEIFAIFFILVILALANDKNIVEKVSNNQNIQFFVCIVVVYCIYNKIPWSLAFVLIFLFSVLFSGFVNNVKGSIEQLFSETEDKKESGKNSNFLMRIGAKMIKMISEEKKGILKKSVRFEKEEKPEKNDEVCENVSKIFGFDDDDDDNLSEVETDTDRDCDDNELLKTSLKSFVKEKIK